jgi:hypothetical protein
MNAKMMIGGGRGTTAVFNPAQASAAVITPIGTPVPSVIRPSMPPPYMANGQAAREV